MYVIVERDPLISDNTSVIGVATDLQNVHRMIGEYFGEDSEEVEYRDIRDSGIEFSKTFYTPDRLYGYHTIITVFEFRPNEL